MRMTIALLLFLITSSVFGQGEVGQSEINAVGVKTLANIDKIDSYMFLLVKREWVDNRDTGYHYAQVKVNVEPLQVYLKFVKPTRLAGREVLYKNDELVVRKGGTRPTAGLVLHLLPTSPLAMEGNKYPITHISPKEICAKLIAKINNELKFPETRVYKKAGASIYDQVGVHYKLIHTVDAPGMQCMTAEMIISDKLGIPIYFKVTGWNRQTLEEYAFQSMTVNVKFDPEDFDEENPNYGFARETGTTE